MDIGRLLLFVPVIIFCFYRFKESKLNIYLIFATLAWYGALYSGKLNTYQTLGGPLKSILNFVTALFVMAMFIPYLGQSIREYKEHNRGR